MRIQPVRIPRNIIDRIPPPVTNVTPPPVVRPLPKPVVEVPNPVIDYPVLDVPTREEFEGVVTPPQKPKPETNIDTRDLPAQINVPGVGPVDLPPVAPLIASGATAVVATAAALGSTIVLNQLKDKLLDPLLKRLGKKKKVKIKQKKPVIHYVDNGEQINIFQYSMKGTELLASVDNIEMYLRDQIEISSLYEYDNKIIINDSLKAKFTEEGQKRFKRHFVPAKAIVKKLSARLSF